MIKDSKLGQFISTLKSEEFKEWEAFISSPFFNTNQNVLKLWKILMPHHPELNQPTLTKEKIYKRIFKSEYKDLKMRKLMSATVKLLEKFWVYSKLENTTTFYENSLADCYYDRGLYEQFEKKHRQQIAVLAKKPFKTAEELLQLIHAYHQLSFNLNPHKKDLNQSDVIQCNTYLWQYTQQQGLFYAADFNNKKTLYDIATPEFIQQLNKKLLNAKGDSWEQTTLVYLYQQVNKMLLTTDSESILAFENLENTLRSNFEVLDKVTNYWLLSHLLNFSMRKERKEVYPHRITALLRFGIQHQLLRYRDRMSYVQFSNTAYQLCLLKEFELAQQFIETHKGYLPPKRAMTIIDLAQANVLFFKGNYKESFYKLSNFYFEERIIFEVGRRGLLLRTTFECYLQDATFESMLLTNLNNYKQYLNNKKQLSEIKRRPYLNFIQGLDLLFKWIKNKHQSIDKLREIQTTITDLKPFPKPAKDWLLAHIRKLL